MEQFPTVLIPPTIRRVKSELPPLPPLTEQPPKLPNVNIQPINFVGIVGEVLIVLVIGILLANQNAFLGVMVLLAGFMGILIHALVQRQNYKQRLDNNTQDMDSYYKALEAYSRQEAEYQSRIEILRSPEKVQEYQYPRLLKVLGRTVAETGQSDEPLLNPVENHFALSLNRHFPNKVYPKPFFEIPGVGTNILDFAYIDRAVNLRVDIEIDEPFNAVTRDPTHYLRSYADSTWNDFLLKKNWVVIRLSGQQVTQHPDSCCKAIAQTIYQILGDPAILQPFEAIPDLQPMNRWTEQEARQIAASKPSL
jgi:hypothetical protein